MQPDIFIRADGNSQIGLGHLVRCSALAYMLKDDFNIYFFCHSIPETLENEFNGNGFKVIQITNEKDFLGVVTPDKIVVLDGYYFDIVYQKTIKLKGAKLVYIDDLHDKEFFADLIINFTPGVKSSDYKVQPDTHFALGPEYSLLRPVFLEQTKKHRNIEKTATLLICFGGADPLNLTEKTLEIVIEFSCFKKIIVITGTAFKPTKKFRLLVLSDERIDHRQSLDDQQMLASMIESEIAVIPASGIILEIFSVGVPAITGYYVPDQKETATNICKLNLALYAGDLRNDFKCTLVNLINSLTIEKAKQMVSNQKLFLSDSKKSIINLFKKLG